MLRSNDIPQANSLPKIRELVDAIASGHTDRRALAAPLGLSSRHVAYYLNAAKILGCIAENIEGLHITDLGQKLLRTKPTSEEERKFWHSAISSSSVVCHGIGDLFAEGLTQASLESSLYSCSNLSPSTMKRRAATLLSWRSQVLATQQILPFNDSKDLATKKVTIDENVLSNPDLLEKEQRRNPPITHLVTEHQRAYFEEHLEKGDFILFTGAGFSCDATNVDGICLPIGSKLAKLIWNIGFPGKELDEISSLPDVFAAVKKRKPRQLRELLERQLRVDANRISEHYYYWFSAPWRRLYTLNIDDLEEAVARRFSFSRIPMRISAIEGASLLEREANQLPVIHLNGAMSDDMDSLTFSAYDYAQRLARDEPWYSQLASDLFAYPFVFVGTVLEEPILWQHMAMRGLRSRGIQERRHRSFLVSPALPLAKEEMLKEFNIEWIKCTTSEFADVILQPLQNACKQGLQVILETERRQNSNVENIERVSDAIAKTRDARSLYLIGAEPTWADLINNRTIFREFDSTLEREAYKLIKQTNTLYSPILLVSGTAGSGKSTSIMQLARSLSTKGYDVAWVGAETIVETNAFRELFSAGNPPDVLFVDDADRYGSGLPSLIYENVFESPLKLFVFSMRSTKLGYVDNSSRLKDVPIKEFTLPHLEDSDISSLVGLLERENRIGLLKNKPKKLQEEAFRNHAGRQLLVAMIHATQGKPLEEKVHEEWRDLPERQRYFYSIVTIATCLHYPLDRELLLLAAGTHDNESVDAISLLWERHLINGDDASQNLRSRHRVVAETLMSELQRDQTRLAKLYSDLAFATAIRLGRVIDGKTKKFFKRLINHEHLFRVLGREGADEIYLRLENLRTNDYHYWLQRGSLQIEHGSIYDAENFLNQAFAIENRDNLVLTAHAYMRFKKACYNSRQSWAADLANEAMSELRRQIQVRGEFDVHPVHILGSQGLSWSRHASLSNDQKKTLLKGLLENLEQAVAQHRNKQELVQLRDDIKRELLNILAVT